MRVRVLVATAVAAIAVMYLLRTAGPDLTEPPAERARVQRRARDAAQPAPVGPAAPRNVFEYADGGLRAAAPARVVPAAAPAGPAVLQPLPSPSPLVRLVGLLRRGEKTNAALAIAGDTMVLGVGESASGYTVESIDEDEGVRVRTPDGSTIVLVAASNE